MSDSTNLLDEEENQIVFLTSESNDLTGTILALESSASPESTLTINLLPFWLPL